jgi:hypothetical protein
MATAEYQLASDGFDGKAYSGVIRGGKFIACAAGSEEWDKYVKWLHEDKDPPNEPAPYLSPKHGGAVIKLEKGEVPVGTMLDSLPPDYFEKLAAEQAKAAGAPAPHAPPHAPPPVHAPAKP